MVRRSNGEIFPFQANKVVRWPNNEDDLTFYLRLRRCFSGRRVTLSFERWSPEIKKEEVVHECCDCGVRIFGLPWNLWLTDMF